MLILRELRGRPWSQIEHDGEHTVIRKDAYFMVDEASRIQPTNNGPVKSDMSLQIPMPRQISHGFRLPALPLMAFRLVTQLMTIHPMRMDIVFMTVFTLVLRHCSIGLRLYENS
jgi:hypothetical protein